MGVCPSALGAARSPSSLGLHCPCTGPGVTERAHLVLLFYANPVSTSIFGGWGGRWQGGHAFSSGLCRGVPIPASTGGVPGAAACRGCRQPPGGVLVGGRANSISMWGRGKKKKEMTQEMGLSSLSRAPGLSRKGFLRAMIQNQAGLLPAASAAEKPPWHGSQCPPRSHGAQQDPPDLTDLINMT